TATALSAGPGAKWRNPFASGPHHAPYAAPRMRGRFARCKWAASVGSGSLCSRSGQWNRPLSARSTRDPTDRRSTGALCSTPAGQRPTSRFTNRSSWWGDGMTVSFRLGRYLVALLWHWAPPAIIGFAFGSVMTTFQAVEVLEAADDYF